jgi:uncharacterized membrane protein
MGLPDYLEVPMLFELLIAAAVIFLAFAGMAGADQAYQAYDRWITERLAERQERTRQRA